MSAGIKRGKVLSQIIAVVVQIYFVEVLDATARCCFT